MKQFLITGAGGFLGIELIRQLSNTEQVKVIALTSQQEKLKNKYKNVPNVIILGRNDIFGTTFSCSEVDIVINCAFPRNTDGVQFADGLLYIQKVLRAVTAGGAGAVINISSQSVYSQNRECAADENEILNLETKYAVGKYTTELLTNCICAGIPHTNLRMASLIGPGFDQRVTNKMVRSAVENHEITVMEGQQKFGFLDIEDAARGIIALAGTDNWSEVYNLGTDSAYSMNDIADSVMESFWKMKNIKLSVKRQYIEDKRNTALNCRELKKKTGFSAQISLQESIDKITKDILKTKI